ncbi:N-6 DNA methylase [Coleofasciculus sp. FACHB-SPT9]|uniref:N-6 DNA methylase n=1 Tax=Cyanophyceae TaxID=3028117 RepID=UPI001687FE74|nr:N-6 DNA methylase [Coleofasciculus sp. FACHB-SPT9]MBD1890516.1 N-6 DNA methylase [Coleofasciculus sp. FACHB-SPT9]
MSGQGYGYLLPGKFSWKNWTQLRGEQLREFLVGELGSRLRSLPQAGWGMCLRTIGNHIEIEHFTAKTLDILVDQIGQVPLETLQDREVLGELFTRLLQNLIKKQKYSGQFFTPPAVVELMVELAKPQPGERIYDPCFGTGGLLVACVPGLREAVKMQSSENSLKFQNHIPSRRKFPTSSQSRGSRGRLNTNGLFLPSWSSIFGVEIDPYLYVIAMVRVMLSGVDNPELELGDTLERPIGQIGHGSNPFQTGLDLATNSSSSPLARQRPQRAKQSTSQQTSDLAFEGFDCILAVPPFGAKVNSEVARRFPSGGRDSGTLFLQHIMAALRPGGRAVVALPEGVLFRSGSEQRVRRILLEEYRVEGVISLPPNAFAPYAGIKTSILVFSRQQPSDSVRFYQVPDLSRQSTIKSIWFSLNADVRDLLSDDIKLNREGLLPRDIAQEFRQGKFNDILWKTPIKKLAERTWRLDAKQTGEDSLQTFLQTVRSTAPNVHIKRLEEIAEIFIGIHSTRLSATLNAQESSAKNAIRVVRGADVEQGKIRFPTSVISIDDKLNPIILERSRLQPDDLLLPRVQSLNSDIKVGVVSQKLVGTVAADSLVVIRFRGLETELSAAYLAAYLSVLLHLPRYQTWLKDHASSVGTVGSSFTRLSVEELRKLPIPVPPLRIQKSLAQQTVNGASNPTKQLLAYLSHENFDLIAEWLETDSTIQSVLNVSRYAKREGNFSLLLRVGDLYEAILRLRNQVAHSLRQTSPILANWILELAPGLGILNGFEEIPPGTARLTVLTNVKVFLTRALMSLPVSEVPLNKRAKQLTLGLLDLVDREIQEQVTDVRVEAKLSPPVIATASGTERIQTLHFLGYGTEVILTLHNIGVIPIRQVCISTRPEFGKAQIPYFDEGQRIDIPLTVPVQEAEGMLNLEVRWSGTLLNGESIEREIPLTIEIRPLEQISDKPLIFLTTFTGAGKTEGTLSFFPLESLEKDLGASPYIVGKPVDREAMFYGRRKVIDTIHRQLSTSNNANVILLEGNRRTGKTSILRYLQREGKLPGWIIVECSFQEARGDEDKVGIPTKEVFRLMAKKLGTAAIDAGLIVQLPNAPSYDPKRPLKTQFVRSLRQYFCEDYPFEDFGLFLQSVLEAASPRRILFMLDEFDKLQEGIDSGVTSSQVPENIRYLFQSYSNLSGIITGSRRLKRLREEYWSVLFGLGYRIGLDPLERDEARELVTQPVEGRLVYVSQARDRVVELCAYQPFLIQSLCNRIFERAAQSNERMITLSAVQAAADEMVRDNEHFRTLWDYAGTERRRFLLSLCHKLEPGSDPVNMALLEIKLEEAEILIPSRKHLGEDIEFLRELELLELDTTGALPVYKLAIPLMADWIRQNIDHEDLRRKAVEEGQENFL